jgi:tetratricopeptide (TPR) repeat protein
MTETLFERYKEALRAGHVAVLRGRLEDAAAAYREAIGIAGDRTVPRTALGGVYLRLGDPAAALEAYEAALGLAPDDDPALLGRAQALVVLRRTGEAALTYDRLAAVRAADGRLRDALEAARRALAIEPSDTRRERHAALVADLRASGDESPVDDVDAVGDASPEPPTDVVPAVDPEVLVAELEEAAARADAVAAASAALEAARAYRRQGHVAAAIDTCLAGIAARPSDTDLHLLLADIAVDCGWTGHAGDTYANLLRLVDLEGDAERGEAIRAAAAERLPGDGRFARA